MIVYKVLQSNNELVLKCFYSPSRKIAINEPTVWKRNDTLEISDSNFLALFKEFRSNKCVTKVIIFQKCDQFCYNKQFNFHNCIHSYLVVLGNIVKCLWNT